MLCYVSPSHFFTSCSHSSEFWARSTPFSAPALLTCSDWLIEFFRCKFNITHVLQVGLKLSSFNLLIFSLLGNFALTNWLWKLLTVKIVTCCVTSDCHDTIVWYTEYEWCRQVFTIERSLNTTFKLSKSIPGSIPGNSLKKLLIQAVKVWIKDIKVWGFLLFS